MKKKRLVAVLDFTVSGRKMDNKCKGCKECGCSITETFIEAMESAWHQKCFLCAACNDPFPG
uniref:LIM zinc-binding domain-containing protein n=1 Tax=Ascaris lumbricoides TaxID=6252 RepID=A0A0M3ILP7_ASCLU